MQNGHFCIQPFGFRASRMQNRGFCIQGCAYCPTKADSKRTLAGKTCTLSGNKGQHARLTMKKDFVNLQGNERIIARRTAGRTPAAPFLLCAMLWGHRRGPGGGVPAGGSRPGRGNGHFLEQLQHLRQGGVRQAQGGDSALCCAFRDRGD